MQTLCPTPTRIGPREALPGFIITMLRARDVPGNPLRRRGQRRTFTTHLGRGATLADAVARGQQEEARSNGYWLFDNAEPADARFAATIGPR